MGWALLTVALGFIAAIVAEVLVRWVFNDSTAVRATAIYGIYNACLLMAAVALYATATLNQKKLSSLVFAFGTAALFTLAVAGSIAQRTYKLHTISGMGLLRLLGVHALVLVMAYVAGRILAPRPTERGWSTGFRTSVMRIGGAAFGLWIVTLILGMFPDLQMPRLLWVGLIDMPLWVAFALSASWLVSQVIESDSSPRDVSGLLSRRVDGSIARALRPAAVAMSIAILGALLVNATADACYERRIAAAGDSYSDTLGGTLGSIPESLAVRCPLGPSASGNLVCPIHGRLVQLSVLSVDPATGQTVIGIDE